MTFPDTVAGAVRSLTGLGVRLLTLHASGGRTMMEAAREAAEASSGPDPPRLLAVTQLTSTDDRMLNEELGISGSVRDSVLPGPSGSPFGDRRGGLLRGRGGLDQRTGIRGDVDRDPGDPTGWTGRGDQKRVMTPEAAVHAGADLLVVGRPITRSADPVATYEAIVEQIKKGRGHRE